MKTFTKILTAAAATALLATGCVNEDPAYKNNEPGTPPDPNAKGYLTLADMSMRVVVDTDTETRPDDTSDETAKPQTRTDEAQPDVDTFIIEIRDATGKLVLQETYGDLKASVGEAGRLELPVGGYTRRSVRKRPPRRRQPNGNTPSISVRRSSSSRRTKPRPSTRSSAR